MAEETVNNMQKQNMPKRSTVLKSVKQDNNCQLNLHLQMQCMTLQTNSSDDEDDNFHILWARRQLLGSIYWALLFNVCMYTVYIHYSFDITCYNGIFMEYHRLWNTIDFIFCPPPLYVQNIFWSPLHWSKIFCGPSKFPPAPFPALIMTGP
jgi:hypothetical protein